MEFRPALGVRRGLFKPRPYAAGIIVHTTGHGPNSRLIEPRFAEWRVRHEIDSPMEAALWLYTKAMKAAPHYVIDQNGLVVQTCPHNLAAWHVGSRGYWSYKSWPVYKPQRYEWWSERWPEYDTPLQIADGALWERRSVNRNTIGIEVIPPPVSTAAWSAACWGALLDLVADVCEQEQIIFSKDTVLSHSDISPIGRTTKRGAPWDPHPSQWRYEWMDQRFELRIKENLHLFN